MTISRYRALESRGEESPPGEGVAEQLAIVTKKVDDLPSGLLIKVHYSSLNFKDALSASGHRGITKHYPHTPGIDAVGVVAALSPDHAKASQFLVGDEVIVTGFDLGMNTPGGFGEYIAVPPEWVVKKPESLSMLDVMRLGTAGLTAGMAVDSLQQVGITPNFGPVAVTGATGGVGSIAIMLLHHLGYHTVAITSKPDTASDYLKGIGADEVLPLSEFLEVSERPMLKPRWGGAVDTVGGAPLMTLLKGTQYGGSVACCGMAASPTFEANVYPFILRGVNLLGVDSAHLPLDIREEIWGNFVERWALPGLAKIVDVVTLEELPPRIAEMLAGKSRGRVVVAMGS